MVRLIIANIYIRDELVERSSPGSEKYGRAKTKFGQSKNHSFFGKASDSKTVN